MRGLHSQRILDTINLNYYEKTYKATAFFNIFIKNHNTTIPKTIVPKVIRKDCQELSCFSTSLTTTL